MEKFCTICGKELVNGKCPCCEKASDLSNEQEIVNNKDEKRFSKNGVIDTAEIKKEAKRLLEGNLWTIWKPNLIVSIISSLLGVLVTLPFGKDIDSNSILTVFANILLLPMTIGLMKYMLNFVRGNDCNVNDLFSFYDSSIINIFLTSFLAGLFVTLWSLLLIIPGIIAAISYSMVSFILADKKKSDAMEVIRESKRLMNGYKLDYFAFCLSFIGWMLLCVLIIPIIYVMPYYMVSNTLYYEELCKIKKEC